MVYKEWCIPRIHSSITQEYIMEKMTKLDIGQVIKVKNIPLKNKKEYCRSIIKMECEPNTENYKCITAYLENEKYFKLVYHFPDYWRIYPNLPQTQR